LAAEANTMAKGDLALSAKCRAIRETDAELWALCANIEEEFADEDEATREAAHRAAGTFGVLIRLAMAALEADGKIYRTGKMRNGQPVFAAKIITSPPSPLSACRRGQGSPWRR
jgi:hypothetical protein